MQARRSGSSDGARRRMVLLADQPVLPGDTLLSGDKLTGMIETSRPPWPANCRSSTSLTRSMRDDASRRETTEAALPTTR